MSTYKKTFANTKILNFIAKNNDKIKFCYNRIRKNSKNVGKQIAKMVFHQKIKRNFREKKMNEFVH